MGANTWQEALRIGPPAGLIAGAAVGILARAAMRAFALAEGMKPEFSVGGTAFVIGVFAVVIGLPLALLYVRFWRPLGMANGWNGLGYGALLFAALVAIPFLLIPSDEADFRMRLVAIAVFLPIPLTFGLTLGWLVERLMARA